MPAPFVHLRVHSDFSLAESTLRLKSIVALAGGDSQPAVAITDTSNMFGALEFSEKMREAGVQPIIGLECIIADCVAAARWCFWRRARPVTGIVPPQFTGPSRCGGRR